MIRVTNFDFLLQDEQFQNFAEAAVNAEKIFPIDKTAAVLNCRRAMELAVKWMYSVDDALTLPYNDKLVTLMSTEDFRDIVGKDIWTRMNFIRKAGNNAAHSGRAITADGASLCLQNLFVFLDFVAYCYGTQYRERKFDETLLQKQEGTRVATTVVDDIDLEALIAENKALKEKLTARRETKQKTYIPKPLELSEFKTRKIYIDTMLRDAGWIEGKNWLNEVNVLGMPNKSKEGWADYVLYGDDGKALAVVEAKKTCVDVVRGRYQAALYADMLEKQQGRRPVVFLTNGFETRIIDNQYPERIVSAIYSKRDLETWFNLQQIRMSLRHVSVNKDIAGRYYQEGAVKAVCESFDAHNRRKALLVMATGSGKTRTVIALCDILLQQGWVKNILFLADRTSLVTQAKRNFVNLLPNVSVTNLCEDKENYQACCVFSTYQTMMRCIDDVYDEQGRLFTCGHFDLIICDEAHRSIYNKYKDIFAYFDALLVGLTATPKEDIDKNTYETFELENGVPTYGYDLAQAVKDGFLVDYMSVESKLKFLEEGIVYKKLLQEEKSEYTAKFKTETGEIPDVIAASALNRWLFNSDTIRKVLDLLMTYGLRIQYGETLGKTIIFAANHDHAEAIYAIFGKEYPELKEYAMVIDNQTKYVQSAIDTFSDPQKLPRIAISVDMLDTGIDIPEVLNLVFFKKVRSKAKFWQMIGRGTRLSPGLIDGKDKDKFYIFDVCSNFFYFRINPQGAPATFVLPLQGNLFCIKTQLIYILQELAYQTEELKAFRQDLVRDVVKQVRQLNRKNFAVKQHLKYVDMYSHENGFTSLTYEDTLVMKDEVAPLIQPDADDASAVRFDALMYGLELAKLAKKPQKRYVHDVIQRARALADVANLPGVAEEKELLEQILQTSLVEDADISTLENIRVALRDLMKFIRRTKKKEYTNFTDDVLQIEWKDAELANDDLKNYKEKAAFYLRQHEDVPVIAKLKQNIPLIEKDVAELERILWQDVGTKEEYELACGQGKPLGEFVREIVGLDMKAAKKAFAAYLNERQMDSRQIYFVNQIIEYIVQNGMMKDLSVLQQPPFNERGSIIDIFTDMSVWMGIRRVIEQINANAAA